MLRNEVKDGRIVYYYGDAEITKDEYLELSKANVKERGAVSVLRYSVSASGRLTEIEEVEEVEEVDENGSDGPTTDTDD